MRQFNQDFAAAMGLKASAPVTLAVFHLGSGDVFVSDRDVSPGEGAPAYAGLVVAWGEITLGGLGGSTGAWTPDAGLELIDAGEPSISALLDDPSSEGCEVELYQWFEGIPYVSREPLGRFTVASHEASGRGTVSVRLAGSFRRRNRVVGAVVGTEEFPDADPQAVGRTRGIVYGAADGVPCLPVSAGALTTLGADITASQTIGIDLTSSPGEVSFPASGTLRVGLEEISYTGMSGRTPTGVARGAGGTAASAHKKGSAVIELRPSYEYLVADHPVKSIGDVYVDGVRVLGGVSRLTDDGGKAKLAFSERFTLEKSVDLSVGQGSHEHGGSVWEGVGSKTSSTRWTATSSPGWAANEHAAKAFKDSAGNYFFITANSANYLDVASIHGQALASGSYTGGIVRTEVQALYQNAVSYTLNAPATGFASYLCDNDWNSYCTIQIPAPDGYIETTRTESVFDRGTIAGAKLCGTYHGATGGAGSARSKISGGPFSGQYITSNSATSVHTVKTAGTLTKGSACAWTDFENMKIKAEYAGTPGGDARYYEHWVEVYCIPYGGGPSPASGVALSGDSAADVVVGSDVTCDVEGYADDPYGTFTGTPGALIENPADVVRHIMAAHMGVPAEEFDPAFEAARDTLNGLVPGGFRLAGLVGRPVEVFALLGGICAQARLALPHDGFKARLKALDGGQQTPCRVVTAAMTKAGSLAVAHTGRDEIINTLPVHYRRRLSGDGAGARDYMAVAESSELYPAGGDPDSVALYGPAGPARPLLASFIREEAAASSVRDFYITRHKDVKRRVRFTAYLDNLDLEAGDVIEMGPDTGGAGLAGMRLCVERVSLLPGGAPGGTADELRVQAREV